MRSRDDQPNQNQQKSKTQGISTKNFIRQIGTKVEVGSCNDVQLNILRKLDCKSIHSARNLALALSGTRQSFNSAKQNEYIKIQSHPWYGTVLLEELTEEDRNFIAFYIHQHSNISNHEFKLKVHSLFIDDSNRPFNHALIQEILLVVAFAEGADE